MRLLSDTQWCFPIKGLGKLRIDVFLHFTDTYDLDRLLEDWWMSWQYIYRVHNTPTTLLTVFVFNCWHYLMAHFNTVVDIENWGGLKHIGTLSVWEWMAYFCTFDIFSIKISQLFSRTHSQNNTIVIDIVVLNGERSEKNRKNKRIYCCHKQ